MDNCMKKASSDTCMIWSYSCDYYFTNKPGNRLGKALEDSAFMACVGLGYMKKEYPTKDFEFAMSIAEHGDKYCLKIRISSIFKELVIDCASRCHAIASGAAIMFNTILCWHAAELSEVETGAECTDYTVFDSQFIELLMPIVRRRNKILPPIDGELNRE